jgi:sec-independent protein translocase protein TatB
MFGLGAWEIALIIGAALIFLGPEKLPEVARTVGRSLRDIRKTANDFTRELNYESYLKDDPPSRPKRAPRDTGPEEDPYRDIAEEEAASDAAPAVDDLDPMAPADGPIQIEKAASEEPLPEIRPAANTFAHAHRAPSDPYSDGAADDDGAKDDEPPPEAALPSESEHG